MTDTLKQLSDAAVPVVYTNWRGETKSIRLILSGTIFFGTTDWHKMPTWLISGFDVDHPAQIYKQYDLTKMVFDTTAIHTTADLKAAVEAEREACAAAVDVVFGRLPNLASDMIRARSEGEPE